VLAELLVSNTGRSSNDRRHLRNSFVGESGQQRTLADHARCSEEKDSHQAEE
jgi:hypothetical protein